MDILHYNMDEPEWVARCPVCAEPIDYCQGHGEIGDPAGFAILVAHDGGDHSRCDPLGCDEAVTEALDERNALALIRAFGAPDAGTAAFCYRMARRPL